MFPSALLEEGYFRQSEACADDEFGRVQFIRHLGIPYCELYDRGYTSLGGTTDTHPNPALKASTTIAGEVGVRMFKPAYELIEDEAERLGRDR